MWWGPCVTHLQHIRLEERNGRRGTKRGLILIVFVRKLIQTCWHVFCRTGAVECCSSKSGCKGWPLNLKGSLAWSPECQAAAAQYRPVLKSQPSQAHTVFVQTLWNSSAFSAWSLLVLPKSLFWFFSTPLPPYPLRASYLLSVIEKGWAEQASHSHFVQNPFCALLV